MELFYYKKQRIFPRLGNLVHNLTLLIVPFYAVSSLGQIKSDTVELCLHFPYYNDFTAEKMASYAQWEVTVLHNVMGYGVGTLKVFPLVAYAVSIHPTSEHATPTRFAT